MDIVSVVVAVCQRLDIGLCDSWLFGELVLCDLKKDNEASAIFQTLGAPKKGFSISVSDPADVTGFLRYMLEAGRAC